MLIIVPKNRGEEMNGKKILNELIAIFIFLNVALFTFNVVKTVANYKLNQTRIDNVIYALEQKGIYLETQLPRSFTPKVQANLSDLVGSKTTVERYNIVNALFGDKSGEVIVTKDSNAPGSIIHKYGSESLEFNKNTITYINTDTSNKENENMSIKNAKKACRAFIKRLNYSKVFKNAYIQYNEVENGLEMTFFQRYKGIPVFDTYITFKLTAGQIQKATMQLGKVCQLEGDMRKKVIYPIDLVLFGIDDELELKKPIYITNITLGYKAVDEKNIALLGAPLIPVYKIELKGLNNPIYVNAYTNKRIE